MKFLWYFTGADGHPARISFRPSNGFYIAGDKSDDLRASNGSFVFSSSATVLKFVNVGDVISLSGRVAKFRTALSPNNLFQTELDAPANIIVILPITRSPRLDSLFVFSLSLSSFPCRSPNKPVPNVFRMFSENIMQMATREPFRKYMEYVEQPFGRRAIEWAGASQRVYSVVHN